MLALGLQEEYLETLLWKWLNAERDCLDKELTSLADIKNLTGFSPEWHVVADHPLCGRLG